MKFYANPYNTDVTGFYFETNDEFLEKSAALRNDSGDEVEEFEIDVIDGTQEEIQLANAIKVTQCNLEEVIDFIDGVEDDWPAVFYQLDNGVTDDLSDAIHNADNFCIRESSLIDAATELADECYLSQLPKETRQFFESYFDYQSFANDCRIGGDMVEFTFAGTTYTCTNANQ